MAAHVTSITATIVAETTKGDFKRDLEAHSIGELRTLISEALDEIVDNLND